MQRIAPRMSYAWSPEKLNLFFWVVMVAEIANWIRSMGSGLFPMPGNDNGSRNRLVARAAGVSRTTQCG